MIRTMIVCLLWPVVTSAQQPTLSIEDVAKVKYKPDSPRGMKWEPGSRWFSYFSNDAKSLFRLDTAGLPMDTMTADSFGRWMKTAGLEFSGRIPDINWVDSTRGWFISDGKLAFLWPDSGIIIPQTTIPEELSNLTVSPDLKVAGTNGNDLLVIVNDSTRLTIATSNHPDIKFGQSVHQNEFGINTGMFWSHSGRFLAFYRADDRPVTKIPLLDITEKPMAVKSFMYPMAGMANHLVTVGVYDFQTGETRYLTTGEPADQYFTNLTFQPDDSALWITHVNRGQDSLQLVKYSLFNDDKTVILSETDPKWIEPEHGPQFFPDTTGDFLWFSKRNGWQHLYHYKKDGTLVGPVTKGNWEILSLDAMIDRDFLFITATQSSPLNRDPIRIDLKTGRQVLLASATGSGYQYPSPDGKFSLIFLNSLRNPGKLSLHNLSGSLIRDIFTVPDPYTSIPFSKPELFKILTPDSVTLNGRLIKPVTMEPGKKYPVILYVYGGPHSQQVTNSFPSGLYHLWFQAMAQRGYAVVTIDNRGTPNRGKDFEQAIFRQAGTVEIADQRLAINYLRQYSWVDLERVGVFGWSYGGFMTASLLTRAPEVFKVGVSGAPVIDWSLYETVYTERYMDTPEQNPDGFRQSSVLTHADKLKGRLLIIHGTADNVVMWQHSLNMVNQSIKKNVQMDYFIYPGHRHGVGGADRIHLYEKITQYFEDHL